MGGTFVALDVETANADVGSVCQIGVVSFTDGEITNTWQSLINPEDDFDPITISIHGIDERTVADAPRFPDVALRMAEMLVGRVVASHTSFDRVSLARVHEKYGLAPIGCQWLDTARVARRAWPQFAQRGYGLAPVAKHCEVEFRHHDAAEDARAAGTILVRAMAETGLGLEQWLTRVNQPLDLRGDTDLKGNPDGELFGEVLVFTGALSLVRSEAAALASQAGCDVGTAVRKDTTILVVGDSDIRKFAGHEKSSKHRKAEELILKGQPIRILSERDFLALVHLGP